MAIALPSFVDALVEGFPPAVKAAGVPQYAEDSKNVGEYIDKLSGRLSALLFHIDRQINNVLIRGGRLPKKLTQWATEARAMKVRVSDLLKEQKKSEELVEFGIRLITHLKKCPFKDDMMCDKPIPALIRNPEPVFADETTEMGILPEDNEAEMSRNVAVSVEPERQSEIQIVDELEIVHDAAEYSVEQTANEERRPISFQETGRYTVASEDNHVWIKLDDQIVSIGEYPPQVNPVLNLVEEDLHELPEDSRPNYYPDSLILLLQRNKHLSLIHRSFFDRMPALSFLDMSDTKIRVLPSSLFDLSRLKVLLLRNCICLEKLPPEVGKLRVMEALDLSGTELYSLPDEAGQLVHLRSLHLSFYEPDDESEYEDLPPKLVSPAFFSELKKVESLSVTVHPEDDRWSKAVEAMAVDISKLERLSYLQFYFPEVEAFERFVESSPSWRDRILSRFNFTIGKNVKRIASRVPDEVEGLFSREERCLKYVNGGNEASPLVGSVLVRATSFYLDHHAEARSLSEFDVSNLQGLRFCVVRECPKMVAILDERNIAGSGIAFPCLEHLRIYFLWDLEHVSRPAPQAGRMRMRMRMKRWMFKTPSRKFEALRHLVISTCPKLRFILRESMLRCLANLEELVVEDCERVERIIEGEKKRTRRRNDVLPGLRKLELRYLPELVSLGCGVCFSEEKVSVYGCPKLILNS